MKSILPLPAVVSRRPAALKLMGTAVLAAGAWALSVGASPAQARDVYWSIGVNSPGVSMGVSNARPVYVQPPVVVYHRPPPVVYHTAPTVVVQQPPVVVYRPYQPYPSRHVQPAVVVQGPVVVYPGWDDRRYRRDRRDRHGHDDRYSRYDDRRGHDDRRGYGYR